MMRWKLPVKQKQQHKQQDIISMFIRKAAADLRQPFCAYFSNRTWMEFACAVSRSAFAKVSMSSWTASNASRE